MSRALVLGYRRGLARALARRGTEYALWNEKPVGPLHAPVAKWIGAFPRTFEEARWALEASGLAAAGPYSCVITGSEAAVMPASWLRRLLGVRATDDAVLMNCRDKLAMKRALKPHGIPMTEFLGGDEIAAAGMDPRAVGARLGWPVVAKERMLSGGRGIVFARSEAELAPVLGPAAKGGERIYERFIDASECSVESFVNRGRILFTNLTEYLEKTRINVMPASVPPGTARRMLEINARVIQALGITHGITHAEFYLRPEGVLFGEIALRPPGGYLMEMIREAYGFDAWAAQIAVEMDEDFAFPASPTHHCAAWILHPGEGRVRSIEGFGEVKARHSVRTAKLKVSVGDEIGRRARVGEDIGHVILACSSRDELLAELAWARRTLKVEIEK